MQNRKRLFWGIACLLTMVALVSGVRGTVTAQDSLIQQTTEASAWMPGRVIVKYKADMAYSAQALSNLAKYNAQRVDRINGLDIDLLQVPEGDEIAVMAALNADPAVEYAELDYEIHAFVTPNDSNFSKQWAHTVMHSENAWNITTGSNSVIIAIVDSGIDEGHPDLVGKIVAGKDYVDGDTNPHDLNGHGTHVAGIAAAMTNNTTGVTGMSWGAKIMPMRVLDADGNGYMSDAAYAIMDAMNAGADIINMSLGGTTNSSTMANAIDQAYMAGVVVIAAAGNFNTDTLFYPAANNHVIAVSATGPTDTKASYSNYGSHIDVAAPGGDMDYYPSDPAGIYSTMPTYNVHMTTTYPYFPKNYAYLNGTSQASPYVAGLAALLLSVDPTLTVDEVESILETTAVDLGTAGFDVYFGHGRIDAEAAVIEALNPPETPVLQPIPNSDGDGTYMVSWNSIPFAASYELQQSAWSDFRTQTVYTTTSTSRAITNIAPDVWYYRVKAINLAGESAWSNTESVGVVPPQATILPIVNAGEPDAYTISWNAVTGADGYELLEGEDTTYITRTTRYKGDALNYTVTGQPGGTWFYKVRAYNEAGNGLYSSNVFTVVVDAPLATPVLDTILNSDADGTYGVTWGTVPTATQYTLEVSSTPYFEAPTVAYSGTADHFNMTGQTVGRWYYRVRAYHNTQYSAWSNTRYTTVKTYGYLPMVLKDVIPSSAASVYYFN